MAIVGSWEKLSAYLPLPGVAEAEQYLASYAEQRGVTAQVGLGEHIATVE
jgi:hypothetical protein